MIAARDKSFPSCLPIECTGSIFSFLSLHDLLQVASTSSAVMRASLPSLYSRRIRLKEIYAYSPDWSNLGFSVSGAVRKYTTALVQFPHVVWVPIPTVAERVEQLNRQIPRSHPLKGKVSELHGDLLDDLDAEDETTLSHNNYSRTFLLFKKVTKALKLHAEILNSVIDSQPLCENKRGSTSLDRYMGDVLCVTYLMNHSHLGIAEGGPSNDSFLKNLRRLPQGASCYCSWVYIHSSILRRKAFSPSQRDRLGIPEYNGLSEIIPTDLYVNNHFMTSVLTLVSSDFGPLGPAAFRGRDHVQLTNVTYHNLFGFWMSNTATSASQRVTDILMTFHEQTRLTRPLTVQPPMVRLSTC